MKNALAIHDLSCFSKSSLTVVLPLLEAAGIECAVLPTAVLSTQSDGFEDVFAADCSEACRGIIEKWKCLGFHFDAIYSGYLASDDQQDIVAECISSFSKPAAAVLVDPVLGDNLGLYPGLTDAHISQMRSLVGKATVITPNWTEAQLLLDGRALFESATIKRAEEYARGLFELSRAAVVITSVPAALGTLVNLAFDGKECRSFSNDMLSPSLPGCGDMFASLLLSLLLDDNSFFVSVRRAGEITTEALRESLRCGREKRMGVLLYPAIRALGRY